MEVEAEIEEGSSEKGLRLPRNRLRSSRPFKSIRRSDWNQETLLQKTW